MKTVKAIYDYFHQFPNADKKSASLKEFLETIPGLLGIESEDMKVTTFKEAYESGMWLYMPTFINPTFIEEYVDEDYSNEYRLEIIKDTLSEKGLGIPSYVYVEDISDEYNTLDDIQRALLVYDTEDSIDYMVQVWYSMEPAVSEEPNKVYASDIIFWGSGFEIEDIVNYMLYPTKIPASVFFSDVSRGEYMLIGAFLKYEKEYHPDGCCRDGACILR